MSAQEFKPGDRVEYVGHPKSGYVSDYLIGKYGTVARQENLSSDSVPVKWDHRPLAVDGVLALNIRLISAEPEDKDDLYVEPEPLTVAFEQMANAMRDFAVGFEKAGEVFWREMTRERVAPKGPGNLRPGRKDGAS